MLGLFDAAKTVSICDVYNYYFGGRKSAYTCGNVSCPLPSHGGADAHPSMHLYNNTNTFYCFKCGAHGSPIDFVMQLKGYSNPQTAAEEICANFNISYQTKNIVDDAYVKYYSQMEMLANDFNKILYYYECPDSEYFQRRGLSTDTVNRYKLGYCPRDYSFSCDKTFLRSIGMIDYYGNNVYADRYMIPIYDSNNHIVGFSGRSLDPDKPKYINTPTNVYFEKRKLLYNYNNAKKYPEIYIVEGYMDALALIESGIENVVALMGTVLTEEHLTMLGNRQLILALDGDDTGYKKMMSIITTYKNVIFKVMDPIPYKDLNECLNDIGKVAIQHFTKKTISGIDYLIKYCQVYYDLSLLQDREKMWTELAKTIGTTTPGFSDKYPLNINYSPVAIDYYWTIVNKIIKGGRR